MSGEPLNPYESPVIPAEAKDKRGEPVGFIASFAMDETGLAASSRMAHAPIPTWVHWTSPILIILFGVGVFIASMAAGTLGTLGFFIVTFAFVFGIQGLRSRRVAAAVLKQLKAHPILGVIGPWKLTVDREQILVETPGGQQSYPRATTPVQALEGVDLVIWFDGSLPILVPERQPYARMCKSLRMWFIKTAAKVQ